MTVSQKAVSGSSTSTLASSNLKLGRDRQIALVPVLSNADSTVVGRIPAHHHRRPIYTYKHLRDNDLDPEEFLVKSGRSAMYVWLN